MDQSLRSLFLLDPDIIFLNHGSFGACPQPVFETYQGWQRRLERQPVLFLGREFPALDRESRAVLAAYLNTSPDHLVYIPNATYGVNAVARSLNLHPGDEILTTNHEYGACNNTWDFISKKTGASIVRQPIPLGAGPAGIIQHLWQGVTPRTRAIYISHITSPTAILFPVSAICDRARNSGILTIIDGAHSPGHIPVDLDQLGADFYVGNLHKWAMSPKGAGFLYVCPELQQMVEPLIVSWGYGAAPETSSGSQFQDDYQWTGTRDPAAALSVPAAIQFMHDHHWEQVGRECHALLSQAVERISALTGISPPVPLRSDDCLQMAVAPLPPDTDLVALKSRLYDQHRIEIPCILWENHKFVRISVQGYNQPEDIDALLQGLSQELHTFD
jgi:isopenicillin-N epimerase